MSRILSWLVGNRVNATLAAVAVLPLLPMISSAFAALDTLANGLRPAAMSALVACLVVGLLGVVLGVNPSGLMLLGAVALFSGVAFGALLGWSGSLTLVFQAQTTVALLGVVVAVVVTNGTPDYFAETAAQLKAAFEQAKASPEQIAAVDQVLPVLVGGVAALLLVMAVAVICLGRYWHGLVTGEPRLGQEFPTAGLGTMLTFVGTLILAAALFTSAVLLDNLAIVVMAAFAIQGLAFFHGWARSKGWSPWIQALPYILLFLPTTMLVAIALAAVGITQGWRSMSKGWRT